MGIYAIWGPPQSGKTSLAIDLAFALSKDGRSVCLVSPELHSELAARLNIRILPEKSLAAARKHTGSIKQLVHPVDELLYVLAYPYDHDAFGETLSQETAKGICAQTAEAFDVVLLDCPAHTGSVLAAWGLRMAEKVLVTTGAHSASVLWDTSYRRALDAVRHKSIHVCDEVGESFDYRTLHTMLGVTPAVHLPYVPGAATQQLLRRTLYQSKGKAGQGYTRGIDELCAILQRREERP